MQLFWYKNLFDYITLLWPPKEGATAVDVQEHTELWKFVNYSKQSKKLDSIWSTTKQYINLI